MAAANECFQTTSFYGTKSRDRQHNVHVKIHRCVQELSSKPYDYIFKSRIEGPSVTWKVFKRQQEAIAYASQSTKDAAVFAYEERVPDGHGRRLFLATHPRHMWLIHKNRPPEDRCTYEVIPEGYPCKLYFDLEFSKITNPEKNGPSMVKIFINCVSCCLMQKFGVSCSLKDVLWLDSSTSMKYSCHLIFQLTGMVFRNNREAGRFVSFVCNMIWKTMGGSSTHLTLPEEDSNLSVLGGWPTPEELWELCVKDVTGTLSLFCDQGVYTKNRNFRIYLSTKFGKNAPLVVAAQNRYQPAMTDVNDLQELLFLDALVTMRRPEDSVKILTFEAVNPENENYSPKNCRMQKGVPELDIEDVPHGTLQGVLSSPYPEIDHFVRTVAGSESGLGTIRSWSYSPEREQLAYHFVGYRFCENIGRHHRSNNILIIADIRQGLYYQRCHDPDCKGFQSRKRPLPPEVLPSFFFRDCLDEESFEASMQERTCFDMDPEEERAMLDAISELEARGGWDKV